MKGEEDRTREELKKCEQCSGTASISPVAYYYKERSTQNSAMVTTQKIIIVNRNVTTIASCN